MMFLWERHSGSSPGVELRDVQVREAILGEERQGGLVVLRGLPGEPADDVGGQLEGRDGGQEDIADALKL